MSSEKNEISPSQFHLSTYIEDAMDFDSKTANIARYA